VIPIVGLPHVLLLRDVDDVRKVLGRMAVSSAGIDIMDKKALFRVVHVKGIDIRAANILKQEMLSRGGEVATSREVYELGGREAECLMMGTLAQYERLLPKLRDQPFGLRELSEAIMSALTHVDSLAPVCHPLLQSARVPLVMGALNVTPDSFSDGGDFAEFEAAAARAREMAAQGADLIDIGGQSTRPGSDPVPLEVEMQRVVPLVAELAPDLGVPISVDTSRAAVAAAALEAGAGLINDVTALRGDPEMAACLRDAACPVVLMHMQGTPATMQLDPTYDDVVQDIYAWFAERLSWAVDQGLAEENLVIDPGIGFGKTVEHNLALLRQLRSFRSLGRPVAVGTSRKYFLGVILDLPEPKDRVLSTVATTVIAAREEAHLVRVHDVAENVQALKVVSAVYG
jgi:dihydropteroate synthase